MKFLPITTRNNWNNIEYWLGEEMLTKEVRRLDVRWPDGTESMVKVAWSLVSTTHYDHGHKYVGGYSKPSIQIMYRGMFLDVPIERVLVRVPEEVAF